MMYHAKLFHTPDSPHLSQLIAGLVLLEARGVVTLDVGSLNASMGELSAPHVLWMNLEFDERRLKLCFDMRDGADYDLRAAKRADVYFKRSYDEAAHAGLLLPYGLNYTCTSTNPARDFALQRAVMGGSGGARSVVRQALNAVGLADPKSDFQRSYQEHEPEPSLQPVSGVVFAPQLWGEADVPGVAAAELEAMNLRRVELVRTLKRALGSRFYGGLVPNDAARVLAPELIFETGGKPAYLREMRRHLVGVATTGLHGSIGWKFAEYIAAGLCVVSEPLNFAAQEPLIDGRHYLSFETSDECLAACDVLLSNPSAAADMQRANQAYYELALRPDRVVERCFETAVAAAQ